MNIDNREEIKLIKKGFVVTLFVFFVIGHACTH